MDLELKNKKVFISGSSRGLGKVLAETYLAEGASVCLSGRDEASLKKTEQELKNKFGSTRVFAFCGDLTDDAIVKKSLAFVRDHLGGLDVLVANAGSGRGKAGFDLDADDWQGLLDLNLIAPALLVRAFYPLLKATKGNVVLISSICGREAIPAAPLPYTVAKQGLLAMTKNYSRLFGDDSVRINMVAPGNILLPEGTWERKLKENKTAVENYIKTEVPLKRFATGQEIADTVVFVSSGRCGFMTGSTVVVDGGQTRGFS